MQGASTPPTPATDEALTSLIAVNEELAKQADGRRQRLDGVGTSLMATAVALGAALVTAAGALNKPDRIPELGAYVALVFLVATVVLAGLSRASVLQRLNRSDPTTLSLWKQEDASLLAIATLASAIGTDAPQPTEREVKEETLLLWQTKVAIGVRSMRYKNVLMLWSALTLAVALTALAYIGVAVLSDSY
jgi:hypothetical protein